VTFRHCYSELSGNEAMFIGYDDETRLTVPFTPTDMVEVCLGYESEIMYLKNEVLELSQVKDLG
jgi:hypothetical protein